MVALLTRGLISALLVALFPLGILRAQEDRTPLAWLTLHSYQRLEQRLRELSNQAKAPALADLLLSILQLRFGGLQGLDRQRPISVLVPTLDDTGAPPVVLALPFSNQQEFMTSLGTLFPTMTPQEQILHLQGESGEAFGRLDEQGKILFLSTTGQFIASTMPVLPPAAFATTAGEEADMVIRVDVGAIKRRHPEAWEGWITQMEEGWQTSFKNFEEQTNDQVDKAFLAAYFAMSKKQSTQFFTDLALGEGRVRLAPAQWVIEFITQMVPGSTTGTFATNQTRLAPRAGRFFSTTAAARFLYTLQVTEALRSDLLPVLGLGRQAAESKLAADKTLTEAQRNAGMTSITQGMRLLEHWIAQPQLDMAAEARPAGGNNMSLTAWIPLPQSREMLQTFLDMVDNVLQLSSPTKGALSRHVLEHNKVAIHRFNLTAESANTQPPDPLFFAAREDTIGLHFGPSPEPLTQLLDRLQTSPPASSQPSNVIGFLEVFVAPWLQAAVSKDASASANTAALAAAATQFQDVREPLRFEAIAQPDTFAMRYLIPGVIIERGAAMLGQQAMQSMQKSLQGQ